VCTGKKRSKGVSPRAGLYDENLGALEVQLTTDDLGAIDAAMAEISVVGDRY
jgi:hypothetical protein